MKTRKKFTRETKISIIRELENGKSAAQVCRENGIHPSMLSKWKREYKENPGIAFSRKCIGWKLSRILMRNLLWQHWIWL